MKTFIQKTGAPNTATLNRMDVAPIFLREVASIVDPPSKRGHKDGHWARHLIDGTRPANSDPFLVLAEDWMPEGTFPMHPHRGIETVTLVLDGVLEHRDTAGNSGVVFAGDVQWMTVGSGVQHQEDPPHGQSVHLLQLWVNLPADEKMSAPRYQTLRGFEMPVRREAGVEVRVFSGRSGQVVAPTLNHVPVTMLDVRFEASADFTHALAASENAFIYVVAGTVWVGKAETLVQPGQLAWLTRSEDAGPSQLYLAADKRPARILIVAGPPLREPVVFGGPFVMNTDAQIKQAFNDYLDGKF